MLAAIRLSRSLRSTSFIASTRIGFSNLSPLGITASFSQILHQDPTPNPIAAAATILSSSFFLTHHPFKFQVRFSSRKSFSNGSEKAPNVTVNEGEDENPKDDSTGCQLSFTRKVYGLLGLQISVTAMFCSAVWSCGQLRGLSAVSPSSGFAFMMLWTFLFGAHFVHHEYLPLNFVALGLVNLSITVIVGTICAAVDGGTLLASVALTTAMASSLTASAFWAAKKGYDFKYLDIILLASVVIYLPTIFVRPPPGSTLYILWFASGGIFWSANIVYHNRLLLKGQYQNDGYASPSIKLYMALMNLFYHILKCTTCYIA